MGARMGADQRRAADLGDILDPLQVQVRQIDQDPQPVAFGHQFLPGGCQPRPGIGAGGEFEGHAMPEGVRPRPDRPQRTQPDSVPQMQHGGIGDALGAFHMQDDRNAAGILRGQNFINGAADGQGPRPLQREQGRGQPEHMRNADIGRDRVRQVIEGLRHEEAQQRDPQVRADRVVDELKDLQAQRDRLDGWRNAEARGKVEADMADLVKGLERDPQVESLVRARAEELGLQGMMRRDESLSHALERSLSRGRGHGMEL